jgi:hypothetical protein
MTFHFVGPLLLVEIAGRMEGWMIRLVEQPNERFVPDVSLQENPGGVLHPP